MKKRNKNESKIKKERKKNWEVLKRRVKYKSRKYVSYCFYQIKYLFINTVRCRGVWVTHIFLNNPGHTEGKRNRENGKRPTWQIWINGSPNKYHKDKEGM